MATDRWTSLVLAVSLSIAFAGAQERQPPPLKEEPGAVPALPERFRDAPRVLVSDPIRPLPPLTLRLSGGETTACYQALWHGDRAEAVTFPIPGEERRKLSVLQLAYDPARRTRYLFYDAGESARDAISSASPFEPQGTLSIGSGKLTLSSAPEDPNCERITATAPVGQNKPWHEGDGPNAGALLARVEIREEPNRTVWGWCLAEGYGGTSTNAALRNPFGGARQEWRLASYVPADGTSIALVLAVSADWTDPRDGRAYRYFQYGSSGFVRLSKEGATAFRMNAGPAVPRPIEVLVFGEEEWTGCASRAAARN